MFTNEREKKTFLEDISKEALKKKSYELLVACYDLQGYPLDKWIELINQVDIQYVRPILRGMNSCFKCDWKKIRFNDDKDHLRWEFLGKPIFDTWLNYLMELLHKSEGQNSIPYFRFHMRDENFIAHRDRFLDSKEYKKALVCHYLSANKLSWAELAQKFRNKNEIFSLICYLTCSTSLVETADKLFKEEYFSLALRCYLHEKRFDKILEKALKVKPDIHLLYQMTAWKYGGKQGKDLLELCRFLLTNSQNQEIVKEILIASLKNLNPQDAIPYYQLLSETSISEMELLGLLERCSKTPSILLSTWYQNNLKKASLALKNLFLLAINQYSFAHLSLALELMHPLTISVANEVLKNIKVESIQPPSKKSLVFLIQAMSHWLDPSGLRYLEAMNAISAAMLEDPREECILFCSTLIEKIVMNSQKDLKLRGPRLTQVQFPGKSTFKDRLTRSPMLRLLGRAESAILKLPSFDAAMASIDLTMAISDPSAFIGEFLNAALHLLKVQRSIPSSNLKNRYAYRRAIFELVISAYQLGNKCLCPTTQLYAIRSSIAILTEAYSEDKHITAIEQQALKELYSEVDRLSKVSPLVMDSILQAYDLIYLDCIADVK